jgi:YVTN family beta-propeller protein
MRSDRIGLRSNPRRDGWRIATVCAAGMCAVAALSSASAASAQTLQVMSRGADHALTMANGSGRGAGAATIPVGSNPVAVAVDQATHTAYVGNGNDGTVSVINTATCSAAATSGCGHPVATVPVGSGPVDAAVNQGTDTVYVVGLNSNTVSVIDGATCNATVTSGCGQTPPGVPVGIAPDGVAVDPVTDTVYVANGGDNTVSVLDGAICNATVTRGCGETPPTVSVGSLPGVPAVDLASDTVYVPNSDGTVSVIDGATCNATLTTGCDQVPESIAIGPNAFSAAVDQLTDTVYVTVAPGAGTPATTRGSVAVINGATCNANITRGCGQTPASVTVGAIPIGVAIDPLTHSVFVLNEDDSTVSVIDGAICNAVDARGCSQQPPSLSTGFNPGYLDVGLASDTLYVSNQDENTVSVLNAADCSLTGQAGCRHPAPTTQVGTGPMGIAVNQRTSTVYVTNQNDDTLSVVSSSACSGDGQGGCGRAWPTVATGIFPQAVAVDEATDTVYVANLGDNTVSVINGATCRASVTSGCGQTPATVPVGSGPDGIAVDQATDTVYVANSGDNTVSVINGATCSATVTSGCASTPVTVGTGNAPVALAVDRVTDTVYVANAGDNTVSVINGATCNATVTSGCLQSPRAIPVPPGPDAVAVDEATDTVYVGTGFFSFTPTALMSVIDGAACNATVHYGCSQAPPTIVTGGFSFGVAVDESTDTVYADSIVGSDTEAFNGATCNAVDHRGCSQPAAIVLTGGWPGNLAVDTATGTVYAPDNVDGLLSYFG